MVVVVAVLSVTHRATGLERRERGKRFFVIRGGEQQENGRSASTCAAASYGIISHRPTVVIAAAPFFSNIMDGIRSLLRLEITAVEVRWWRCGGRGCGGSNSNSNSGAYHGVVF